MPEITVDELAERLAAGAVVVDVREPDEYTAGHVASARPLPLAEVPERAGEVPTGQPVYLICARGGRSRRAAEWLAAQGVQAVNVDGGTMGWIESGRPVVTGEAPG